MAASGGGPFLEVGPTGAADQPTSAVHPLMATESAGVRADDALLAVGSVFPHWHCRCVSLRSRSWRFIDVAGRHRLPSMNELCWDGFANVRDLGGLPTRLSASGRTAQGRVAHGPRRERLTTTGSADARRWGLRVAIKRGPPNRMLVAHETSSTNVRPIGGSTLPDTTSRATAHTVR